jgi:tripartite-type tricarboxylate transporter receptor subunit TctC
MGQALGQPVVVENKAGADGIAGVAEVTHSEPDGYTLLFGVETMVLSPYLYRNPGFDPVRDLQPVSEVLSVPVALFVQPDMLVNSLKELAAYSRVKPGMLTAGSAEVGTAASLCLEMFLWLSGADLTHKTYPSADAAISDFVGGKTQVIALSTAAARPYVRSGQMKPLAVAAPQRSWMLPDVPTTAEAGYAALEFSTWMGLLGPAGLSSDVVDRVREAAVQALNDPANAKLFAEQGLDILGTTPADFGRFISSETAKFGKAVSMAGIRPE